VSCVSEQAFFHVGDSLRMFISLDFFLVFGPVIRSFGVQRV